MRKLVIAFLIQFVLLAQAEEGARWRGRASGRHPDWWRRGGREPTGSSPTPSGPKWRPSCCGEIAARLSSNFLDCSSRSRRRRCGDTRSRSARAVRDRLSRFADELGGAFVEADHGSLRVKLLGIEGRAHLLHARDVLGTSTLGMHHMSFCQGLRWFSAKRRRTVSREKTVMVGQLDHRASQQLQRPSGRDLREAGSKQAVAMRRASSLLAQLTISACSAAPRSGRLRDYL